MNTIEFARLYVHGCKWSVIPLLHHDKRPAIQWKPYQDRLPTDDELVSWFRNTNKNIGIVCGQVSGGLVVVDLETQEAVTWSIDQKLPQTLAGQDSKRLAPLLSFQSTCIKLPKAF